MSGYDPAPGVAAELADMYKRRAGRLRRDACRKLWRSVWLAMTRAR